MITSRPGSRDYCRNRSHDVPPLSPRLVEGEGDRWPRGCSSFRDTHRGEASVPGALCPISSSAGVRDRSCGPL